MKIKLRLVFAASLATVLCSCVGTTMKQTWKSPDYHAGQIHKVAVVAADPRENVRFVLEGQWVTQLQEHGVAAFETRDIMSVAQMKADRKAAAAKLRELGADSVLVMRLASSEMQPGSNRQFPGHTGLSIGGESYGSFDVYWVGYVPPDPEMMMSQMVQDVFLETSVFELKDGQRLWTGLTKTVLTENTDRLELVRPLVTKVITAMQKDGIIQ
jgi:hypothetical protein